MICVCVCVCLAVFLSKFDMAVEYRNAPVDRVLPITIKQTRNDRQKKKKKKEEDKWQRWNEPLSLFPLSFSIFNMMSASSSSSSSFDRKLLAMELEPDDKNGTTFNRSAIKRDNSGSVPNSHRFKNREFQKSSQHVPATRK